MIDVVGAVAVLVGGLIMGVAVPGSWIVPLIFVGLLMCVDMLIEEREAHSRSWLGELILTLGAFNVVLLFGALVGNVVGGIARHPFVLLYAFWLYALIATGYLISRCSLGWHVGASAAVLTAFIAIGLFIRSFFGAGPEWIAALIMAAGLWWGADSWRRANGLALNE